MSGGSFCLSFGRGSVLVTRVLRVGCRHEYRKCRGLLDYSGIVSSLVSGRGLLLTDSALSGGVAFFFSLGGCCPRVLYSCRSGVGRLRFGRRDALLRENVRRGLFHRSVGISTVTLIFINLALCGCSGLSGLGVSTSRGVRFLLSSCVHLMAGRTKLRCCGRGNGGWGARNRGGEWGVSGWAVGRCRRGSCFATFLHFTRFQNGNSTG